MNNFCTNSPSQLLRALGAAVLLLAFSFCGDQPCRDLADSWTNREGQTLVFQPGGKALWLIRFGSATDSFPISYRYDCAKSPAEIDFTGFQAGPLAGKSLFGIIEWKSDTSFRVDFESGTNAEVRPKEFNSEQAQTFDLLRSQPSQNR